MPLMAAFCPCKSYLVAAVKAGNQALTKEHRSRIQTKVTTTILASMDFDEATRPQFPQCARWDYLLEVKSTGEPVKTIAVEFHSVELSRLQKKRRESKEILLSACDPVPNISEWILVPEGDTGGYALSVRRKLAEQGIRTVGRSLTL